MGNKDKSLKRRYKKKRKYNDNRHTKKSNTTTSTSTPIINQVNPTTSSSTDLPGTILSSKKLKLISNNSASNNNEISIDSIDRNDGDNCTEAVCGNNNKDVLDNSCVEYSNDNENVLDRSNFYAERDSSYCLLLDSDILQNTIDLIGKCPTEACTGNVKYYNEFSRKQGLSCKLEFPSTDCSWSYSFYTSKKVSKASAGKNPFCVNMRAIIALRENGKGYAGLESVCGYMNLVPPMNVNSFNKSMSDIISSYKQCAEDSMNSAAENVRQMNNEITVDNETIVDIVVSSDGAWQKRGHDSLNGVASIIQNDVEQCIDYRVLSKKSNACSKWETKKDTVEF